MSKDDIGFAFLGSAKFLNNRYKDVSLVVYKGWKKSVIRKRKDNGGLYTTRKNEIFEKNRKKSMSLSLSLSLFSYNSIMCVTRGIKASTGIDSSLTLSIIKNFELHPYPAKRY